VSRIRGDTHGFSAFSPDFLTSLRRTRITYNKSGKYDINKLAGLKPGEGQWRIRVGDCRLRYDIFGRDIVRYSTPERGVLTS